MVFVLEIFQRLDDRLLAIPDSFILDPFGMGIEEELELDGVSKVSIIINKTGSRFQKVIVEVDADQNTKIKYLTYSDIMDQYLKYGENIL